MAARKKIVTTLPRGATKPPMFLGIPYMAFIAAILPPVLLSISLSSDMLLGRYAYLLLLIPVITLPIMRELTKRDDQYLRMMWIHLKEKFQIKANKQNSIFVVPPRAIRHKE